MAIIGLTLIVAGWLYQLFSVMQKKKEIKTLFILIYAAGVLLLTVDGFENKMTETASLNLISFIVSVLVLLGLRNTA